MTEIPYYTPGERVDSDVLMNIVYENLKGNGDAYRWNNEGCGDDSRDGYELAVKQFQAALEEVERLAYAKGRERGYSDGQDTLHPQNGKAFAEGRLLGLKQMDMAHYDKSFYGTRGLLDLRKEYESGIGAGIKYHVKF